MGLNYLLRRHQIELMMASAARSVEARASHRQLAARYAWQIESLTRSARPGTAPLVPLA